VEEVTAKTDIFKTIKDHGTPPSENLIIGGGCRTT
jgi:hypothetical protein